MKRSTLLLIIYLALSNCSISIESKSKQTSEKKVWLSKGEQRTDYNSFEQTQAITGGGQLTVKGREVDIVPLSVERVKLVNKKLFNFRLWQLAWTFGIETQVLV